MQQAVAHHKILPQGAREFYLLTSLPTFASTDATAAVRRPVRSSQSSSFIKVMTRSVLLRIRTRSSCKVTAEQFYIARLQRNCDSFRLTVH